MPASDYIIGLRTRIGHDLLLTPAVMVALFDEQGRLLLGRNARRDQWFMIGGITDPGESPADTAVREVWEETGLTCELTALRAVLGGPDYRVTFENGDKVEPMIVLFEGRMAGGSLRPDQTEIEELRFVTAQEAAELPLGTTARRLIDCAFRRELTFEPPQWRPPGS